jgi:hypothetical protein
MLPLSRQAKSPVGGVPEGRSAAAPPAPPMRALLAMSTPLASRVAIVPRSSASTKGD